MYEVFLSYRRDDSAHAAHRIREVLREKLGEDAVFMDTQAIRPGEAFPEVIQSALAESKMVLAIIGRNWLCERLHDEGDLLRKEIETALHNGIPVVPVLIDGAAMPKKGSLPSSVERLAKRNNWRLGSEPHDFERLAEWVRENVRGQPPPEASDRRPTRLPAIGAVCAVGFAGVAASLWFSGGTLGGGDAVDEREIHVSEPEEIQNPYPEDQTHGAGPEGPQESSVAHAPTE